MADHFSIGEVEIRLLCFAILFVLMAAWEIAAPKRVLTQIKSARWLSNLSIMVLNTALVRLILPTAIVGIAVVAEQRGWGLLNLIAIPAWIKLVLSLVLLDLGVYLQHLLFHLIPGLWRIHSMHHSDLDFDVTTAVRFHPLEILLSAGIKALFVLLLGAPILAVLLFEVILNGVSMFNHANIRLPDKLEGRIRALVVTPDMHRIHHSVVESESNRNFGFNLSIWDRLFGTYQANPAAGQLRMEMGLAGLRKADEIRLDRMLTQPFRQRK